MSSTPASPARRDLAVQDPTSLDGPGYKHEFFRPRSAVWWLFCILVGLGGPGVIFAVAKSFTAAKEPLLAIAPIFAVTLALFAVVVLWADPYRARRPWILTLAVVYGATVPTWLALHANEHLFALTAKLLPAGVGADWGAAVAGPTSEEWGKTLGVVIIMLVASRTLRRPMHGLLVGAFVGLGFQILENVSYAANNAPSNANDDFTGAFSVTLLRSAIGISSHWLYTAIIGVGRGVPAGAHREAALGDRADRHLRGILPAGLGHALPVERPVPRGGRRGPHAREDRHHDHHLHPGGAPGLA